MIDDDKDYTMHEGTEVLRERSSEEAILHMDKKSVLPEELTKMQQFDTELGTYLCGGIEDYLEALEIFADSIAMKAEKIEKAYDSKDVDIYTTLVHSLKSSARTVGAVELSGLAKKLEMAGKSGDMDCINKNTSLLLTKYKEIEQPLRDALDCSK